MKKWIFALLLFCFALPAFAAKDGQSVYERVMESGKIRCGYGLWTYYLNRDPNTGEWTGIYYDFMKKLAANLGLEVEWTEEIGWGDFVAALEHDRIDAYCTTVSWNAERARLVDFIHPIFYMRSDVFVQADDNRFDNDVKALNDNSVTLTTIEGDIYHKISTNEFPAAQQLALPQLATPAELFLSVADGKADAAITESSTGMDFMKKNPGRIKMVELDGPFRFLPVSFAVKGGEYRFQRMLEIATVEMLSNGTVDRILDKYEKYPGSFLRVAKPYERPGR